MSSTPTSTTSSNVAPPAARMARQFSNACRVWSWIVAPASEFVLGSMPTMPETKTLLPARTPWLYSGELGASAVVMIYRGMVVLPLPCGTHRRSVPDDDRCMPVQKAPRSPADVAAHEMVV